MRLLITGTSRGIGLELTQVALAQNHQVFALAREPNKSKKLCDLKEKYFNSLTFISCDLTNETMVSQLNSEIGENTTLDILINNAGIMRVGDSREDFMDTFLVNSYIPYLTTKVLLSNLKKSSNPKVMHITSAMGSISENQSGGYYTYRASKAALNMINKSLTIDNPWLQTLVMHPGWVKTDMGGSNAPLMPEDSAKLIWEKLIQLPKSKSGCFIDCQGRELPW